MKTKGNTILITGGATGIGFSLAEAFVKADNEVIICGRRGNRLREAKARLPEIHIKVLDLSKDNERRLLYQWTRSHFEKVNVLVNNAGIQRTIDLTKGIPELFAGGDEIEINLVSYIHLSAHFIPLFLKQEEAAIVNVSSGLCFTPIAAMPVYCATKAAIHSFTQSLRHQLRDSPIKVFEVIPPTVDTELDKGARQERKQVDRGVPPSEVAKATLKAMRDDKYEVVIGMAENLRTGARMDPERTFHSINE